MNASRLDRRLGRNRWRILRIWAGGVMAELVPDRPLVDLFMAMAA
jgi:hypothetical protein